MINDHGWRKCVGGLGLCALVGVVCWLPRIARGQAVVPVNWNRFSTTSPLDPFYQDVQSFLNDSARYNVNWVASRYASVATGETPTGVRYDIQTGSEGEIRSLGHISYGMAAMLKSGAFDANETGISAATFQNRAVEMIHGATVEHKANGTGVQWGNSWQSALWAADLAESAWMLWDELPSATRNYVRNMTVYEANRFVNYDVPYWSNPDGSLNSPGDTKAEENAWNSRILSVAVAMMPQHANSAAWRSKASELMVSSFSRPSDLQNLASLDGRSVADWVEGYNAYETGFVENHGFIHNDYLATTELILYPFITQSLANQAVPQAAGFNFPVVYNAMATEPVGSQHRPMFQRAAAGQYFPDQYYPQGTDWSLFRYDIFLEMDAFAEVFDVDVGKSYDAAAWGSARLDRILQMQRRHSDGKLYAPGEFDSWAPRDAYALEVLSRVWMMNWLDKQDAVSGQSNWNASLAALPPAYLQLQVDRGTGEVVILNDADVTNVELTGYVVRSPGGRLDEIAWNQLGEQGLGSWIAANPSGSQLGELHANGAMTMASEDRVSLGRIYDSAPPSVFGSDVVGDLQLKYVTAAGDVLSGEVRYVGVPRNNTLLLVVDPNTGAVELRNETPFTVAIEGYVVESASGALLPNDGAWISLTDQRIDAGAWIEANPGNLQVAELNAVGATTLTPGAVLSMGELFDVSGLHDLSFQFLLAGGAPLLGSVIYESISLPGDFDVDGDVDGGDFLAWQRGLGSRFGVEDLIAWKNNFGSTGNGVASLASSVPEPAAIIIAMTALVTGIFGKRREVFRRQWAKSP